MFYKFIDDNTIDALIVAIVDVAGYTYEYLISFQWRHNERDGVSNLQRLDCYSIVCSGADQRKHQSTASLTFVRGNSPMTGEIPAQRDSNAENVSIWWRHHDQLLWSVVINVNLFHACRQLKYLAIYQMPTSQRLVILNAPVASLHD